MGTRRAAILRNRWFVAAAIAAALSASGWGGVRYWKKKSEAARLKKLVAAQVQKGEFTVQTQAAGVVEPLTKVPVIPPFAGRMEKLLVKEGDRVAAGQILAWMSSADRAAIMDSARARGETEFKKWDDTYKPTPLVAPIDGEVIKRAVSPGQTVGAAQEALTLSDRLIVKTFVDESDIAKIHPGQKAEFVLDAYLKEREKGEVVSVALDSTLQNNVTVYEVKLRPLSGAARLRSGMTAEVAIEIERKKEAVFVPKRAVKYKEGETIVMLRKDRDAAPVEQKVSLGASNEKFTEILSGVAAGATVMLPSSPVPDEDEHVVEVN